MKMIISFILLLIISEIAISQQSESLSGMTSADYIKKSNGQKRAAWIFLGAGALFTVTGKLLTGTGKEIRDPSGSIWGIPTYSTHHKNDGIGAAFGLTGVLSMLTSIPVFLACHRNKKKARSLSFKNEPIPRILNQHLVYSTVPSVSLKISL